MLWCWPDPEAGVAESAAAVGRPGFEQLGDLSRVSEMCFSADGGFLFVGDLDGGIGVFEVREGEGRAVSGGVGAGNGTGVDGGLAPGRVSLRGVAR